MGFHQEGLRELSNIDQHGLRRRRQLRLIRNFTGEKVLNQPFSLSKPIFTFRLPNTFTNTQTAITGARMRTCEHVPSRAIYCYKNNKNTPIFKSK